MTMNFNKFSILGLVFFSQGILSRNADPSLIKISSRSIMPSCEFIYSVESDVRVRDLSSSTPSGGRVLRVSYDNAWTEEVEDQNIEFVTEDQDGGWNWTFESMSTSQSFLYRNILLQYGFLDEDDNFYARGPRFMVDVGRRFGEACNRSRSAEAAFIDREVTVVDD